MTKTFCDNCGGEIRFGFRGLNQYAESTLGKLRFNTSVKFSPVHCANELELCRQCSILALEKYLAREQSSEKVGQTEDR